MNKSELNKLNKPLFDALELVMKYYEKAMNTDFIVDKAAWALYQAWRDVDSGERSEDGET